MTFVFWNLTCSVGDSPDLVVVKTPWTLRNSVAIPDEIEIPNTHRRQETAMYGISHGCWGRIDQYQFRENGDWENC